MSATFGAPFVEETLKGAVLVGLLWRRRQEFDGPTDGIIYAAMVGLGFAMIENVGYYINALVTPDARRRGAARASRSSCVACWPRCCTRCSPR